MRGVQRGLTPNHNRPGLAARVLKHAGSIIARPGRHPAYKVLNGPSCKGTNDLFVQEITSQLPGVPAGQDYTASFSGVRTYDAIKVYAVLDWIDGFNSTPDGSSRSAGLPGPPAKLIREQVFYP